MTSGTMHSSAAYCWGCTTGPDSHTKIYHCWAALYSLCNGVKHAHHAMMAAAAHGMCGIHNTPVFPYTAGVYPCQA